MPLMIADQATHYQDPYHAKHAEFPDRCLEQHGNPCCEDEITAGNLYEEHLDSLNASGVVVGFARCQYIDRRFCWTCNVTKQGLLHYDGTLRPYLTAAVERANRKYQVLDDTTIGKYFNRNPSIAPTAGPNLS